MPNEALITQIENILSEVVDIGGRQETTSIVTNLEVVDASPSGLTGFVTIKDERDGDTILAKTIPGIEYAASDLVNVLFVNGTEPVAFQQASQSSGSNALWGVVPSTSTDIFYNSGNVGIGKSVAPDAAFEILKTTAQLRLTHTEDSKFVDFTLDTNHDLTVTPSSTGQVTFQPTTDSLDFFQVLDADGGTPVFNVDSTNERVGIKTATPAAILEANAGTADPVAFRMNREVTATNSAQNLAQFRVTSTGTAAGGLAARIQLFAPNPAGTLGQRATIDGGITGTSNQGFMRFSTTTSGNTMTSRMYLDGTGDIGVSIEVPLARFHIDQPLAGGAKPVLLLDQADIDQPFTKYVGSATAANLNRSIVAEADVTTATRQGFFRIEIEDIGNQVTDQDYFVPFYTLA